MDFKEAYGHTCSSVGLAARAGDVDTLKTLLDADGSVDTRDNRGWISTHEAAYNNKVECLKLLLNLQVCKDDKTIVDQQTFEGETALVLAARQGHADCVLALIEYGADLRKDTHEGFSPLWEAVCSRSIKCVELLLSSSNVRASHDGDSSPVVDVNCKTYTGQRPLHQAAETGQCEVIKLLLTHGAKVDSFDDNHISPVFLAAHAGQTEAIIELLQFAQSQGKGDIVNEAACDKATPLYLAAQMGHTNCVKLLLEKGADPHLKAENPTTLPIHAAVQCRNFECLEILLDATSQSVISDCGVSLFDVLLPNLNLKFIQTLIKHGIDISDDLNFIPAEMVQENSYSVFPFVTEEPFLYKHLTLVGLAVGGDVDIFPEPSQRCPIARCLLEAGQSPDPQIEKEIPPIVAAVYTGNCKVLDILLENNVMTGIQHPDFLGNVAVIMASGSVPPSACLLQLFLAGKTPDSCFGRQCRKRSSTRRFSGKKWTIQKLLMCYPDRNAWLTFLRLKSLISLCWSPQLHNGLQNLVHSFQKWQQLQELTAECSTLAHLCRRKIYQTVASHRVYNSECFDNLELPSTVKQYLLTSSIGLCYQEMSNALYTERSLLV